MRLTPFVLIILFAFTTPAHAVSIAIVDMQRVMGEANAAKSAKSQLENKQKEFQKEVDKTESELQKGDQELAKQRSLLSNEAFKEKLQDFRDKAASAQKDVQGKRLKLRRAFELSIVTIQKKVVSIIEDMSNERSYDAVMPKAQMLYAKNTLDITDEVLNRLNKELPALKVDFGG